MPPSAGHAALRSSRRRHRRRPRRAGARPRPAARAPTSSRTDLPHAAERGARAHRARRGAAALAAAARLAGARAAARLRAARLRRRPKRWPRSRRSSPTTRCTSRRRSRSRRSCRATSRRCSSPRLRKDLFRLCRSPPHRLCPCRPSRAFSPPARTTAPGHTVRARRFRRRCPVPAPPVAAPSPATPQSWTC